MIVLSSVEPNIDAQCLVNAVTVHLEFSSFRLRDAPGLSEAMMLKRDTL